MPKIFFLKNFSRSYKKLKRSGRFEEEKLKQLLIILRKGELLEGEYKDHKLNGKLSKYRECYVENDLLLIYEVVEKDRIDIVDIGSHSDLFN